MCSFMVSLTFFVYSKQHSVHSENRHLSENRSSGRLQEVKNNWKIIKVVAVAHRRWSFSRDSNYKALTGKVLMVWLGRRLWEVVAYERWSHM